MTCVISVLFHAVGTFWNLHTIPSEPERGIDTAVAPAYSEGGILVNATDMIGIIVPELGARIGELNSASLKRGQIGT